MLRVLRVGILSFSEASLGKAGSFRKTRRMNIRPLLSLRLAKIQVCRQDAPLPSEEDERVVRDKASQMHGACCSHRPLNFRYSLNIAPAQRKRHSLWELLAPPTCGRRDVMTGIDDI